MKRIAILFAFCLPALHAQMPSGERVLEMVDANMASDNRVVTATMVIHGRRGIRTIASKSWIEGETKSFTEYTAPAREKGTKMLKLQDRLWIYSPSTDRTIRISGHMLRQSVMGSDLSYEDMMEDPKLSRRYRADVTEVQAVGARTCWVVNLTAVTPNVAYHSRRLWVDTERHVPLKEELYAKGGKLLKRLELSNLVKVGGRWYPKRLLFKDVLKEGDGTVFLVETLAFDQDIPEYIFSKAALRR